MAEYILEADGLTKTFLLGNVEIQALKNVSLKIASREFTALVGPSGSGKSTLLHLAAGFDKPTGGEIRLLGDAIHTLGDRELSAIRNRKIGFIFQTFNLIPVLDVYENIEYPCLIYPDSRANKKYIDVLLKEIGMQDKKHKRPNQLSGGERQRVAIARALVNRPAIVFADEPTANLDHKTGELIMDLMKEMNEKYGTTFLFSTHDEAIMKKSGRFIHLQDGELKG